MDWYPDEYDMITFLAQGDYESFNEFASEHNSYTKHLVGYGLLQQSIDGFTFNIELSWFSGNWSFPVFELTYSSGGKRHEKET
jgi:hypothetical protein